MEQSKVIEFHNAYIKGNSKELDRLWKEEAPATLIKFYPGKYETDGRNYFLDNLNNRALWLSSPALFNDPFDSVINFNYEKECVAISTNLLQVLVGKETAEEILNSDMGKKTLDRIISEFENKFSDVHKKIEKSMYSTCFSEVENLMSLRMWSYYANNHSGVCVEYEFDKVNKVCEFGCIPIKYTNLYEYFINPNDISEGVCNFIKLYTKSSEWEYEKEWRVSCQIEKDKWPGFNIPFSFPQKIYFGCRAKEKLKNDVLALCENEKVEIYQMKLKPGSFFLDYDRMK